jgi:alkanesulfonate monooxygenase SsuD/methylene tetrahydromethanopterin reductase-like flavin-dependent oxidoreductase (luciferase family)
MKFALSLPNAAPPARLIEIAVAAEESGWDGVFLWDHIHLLRALRLDVHDPWVVLGAIAYATDRVRLGALVTPLPRRRPQKFAKEVVTLDHLSAGRVVVGIGLGYPPDDEFDMFGEDGSIARRAAMTDEALEVVTALWTAEPVRHDGAHYYVDAELRPAPVQRPRPPIWVACQWPARGSFRRALRWDGVMPIFIDGASIGPEVVREVVTEAATHREEPGRAFDIVVSWDPAHSVAEYEEAGATWLIESRWPEGDWLAELDAAARRGPTPTR